jgi:hypothetical protein
MAGITILAIIPDVNPTNPVANTTLNNKSIHVLIYPP